MSEIKVGDRVRWTSRVSGAWREGPVIELRTSMAGREFATFAVEDCSPGRSPNFNTARTRVSHPLAEIRVVVRRDKSFGSPPPAPPVQRIDGLTPHQCFQAFEVAQRDQRTFELELPAHLLQGGDVITLDTPTAEFPDPDRMFDEVFVVEHSCVGRDCLLTLRAEGRNFTREIAPDTRFQVRRSTALTPAQREAARAIWGRLLRHDVGVSQARAVERAPSVAIANEDLEIEALAGDVE